MINNGKKLKRKKNKIHFISDKCYIDNIKHFLYKSIKLICERK